jgi:hypothetical protein
MAAVLKGRSWLLWLIFARRRYCQTLSPMMIATGNEDSP